VHLELVCQVGDVYVMFVNMPFWYFLTAITEVEVGDLTFVYSNSQQMHAYKDGKFLYLKEAYEAGWLNEGQLLTVWTKYATYKRQYPQTNNPNLKQPTGSTPSASEPGPSTPKKWIQVLTTMKQGERVRTQLIYDDYGNLKEVNGIGGKYKVETNAVERTMTVYFADSGDVMGAYQYDTAGNLIRYQNYDTYQPFTVEYVYDAEGKLLKEINTFEGKKDVYTGGHRWEMIYAYDGAGRRVSQRMYVSTQDSTGQEVCNPMQYAIHSYDALGNLIRTDWYDGRDEKIEHMIYTFDANLRAEKLEHFVVQDTWEGKIDVLQAIHIYYYNAEGNVICHEQYDPGQKCLTHVETYEYQAVQVPEDFFGPTYMNVTERKVVFRENGEEAETPFIPQPDQKPTNPNEPTLPDDNMEDTTPTEPIDAVFNTKNIVRITFYAYFGQGKGSDVPSENMAEIINWLNSFTVGEKTPALLPPGTGTLQVEIEYADGTVVKRSLDTITINGVCYYLDSDPQPAILEEILSMVSQ
jgi:YD repeat-containing protein